MNLPSPPWSVRQRLRVREYRRDAVRALARLLARAAEQLDPPPEVMDRARTAAQLDLRRRGRDLAARARHPSAVADGIAQGRADLQLAHGHREPEWTRCNLGVITATRPLGSRVRFDAEPRGRVDGLLLALAPSELSSVYYRIEVGTLDGRREYDLPLSHPLEVLR